MCQKLCIHLLHKFTFHIVNIKSNTFFSYRASAVVFTFHIVNIKSFSKVTISPISNWFTFHIVNIKCEDLIAINKGMSYLHST